jgi:hypothetical protein
MNEPDFRDYPRLPNKQPENILAMTDDVGASTPDRRVPWAPLATLQRQCLKNSNEEFVARNEDK